MFVIVQKFFRRLSSGRSPRILVPYITGSGERGFEMTDALERLREEKIPFLLCGYSSLDRYFRVREAGRSTSPPIPPLSPWPRHSTTCTFPGLPAGRRRGAAADGHRLVFRCVDSLAVPPTAPFTVLRLLYDPGRNAFIDRLDMYPDLRAATSTRRCRFFPAVASALRGGPPGFPLSLHG